MSHRDLAAYALAAWTAAAAGGVAAVLRSLLKAGAPGAAAVIAGGMSLLCGAYAAAGWAWWLATGAFR